MSDFIFYYLIFINIITFIFYAVDKFKAKKKLTRIKELTLLNLSLFGGCFLAIFSMYLFHHKTRKKLFVIGNIIMCIIYILIIYYFWRYL